MNTKKGSLTVLLALVVSITSMNLIPTGEVYAATEKEAAKKAYKKFLSNTSIDWGDNNYPTKEMTFYCADINQDKIPELFVHYDGAFGYEGFERMYTYSNGKVKQIWAAGNCIYADKYYAKKKIFVSDGGRMGYFLQDYYKVSGSKMTLIATYAATEQYDSNGNVQYKKVYKWKGKEVSKKKYQSNLKKSLGSAKATKIKYRKNTAGNRKKVLG